MAQKSEWQRQRDADMKRLRRANMTEEERERERQRLHESYLQHKAERETRRDAHRRANLPLYAERQRRYRAEHADEIRLKVRTWYRENRDQALAYHKTRRDVLRAEMIAAYGGKCVCCGESNPRFLTIDHVDGGGTKHRRSIGWSGNGIFAHLKKLGWPQEGYQLLCFNCNCGRAFNGGVCPHVQAQPPDQATSGNSDPALVALVGVQANLPVSLPQVSQPGADVRANNSR